MCKPYQALTEILWGLWPAEENKKASKRPRGRPPKAGKVASTKAHADNSKATGCAAGASMKGVALSSCAYE